MVTSGYSVQILNAAFKSYWWSIHLSFWPDFRVMSIDKMDQNKCKLPTIAGMRPVLMVPSCATELSNTADNLKFLALEVGNHSLQNRSPICCRCSGSQLARPTFLSSNMPTLVANGPASWLIGVHSWLYPRWPWSLESLDRAWEQQARSQHAGDLTDDWLIPVFDSGSFSTTKASIILREIHQAALNSKGLPERICLLAKVTAWFG